MLIKMDHRVSWLLAQDRDDVVKQLEASGKIYNWVKGEDVGDTVERWALANPRGMIAQLADWTKATYMERLDGVKNKKEFDNYGSKDFDPTTPRAQGLKESVDREQNQGIQEVKDYVKAQPKRSAERTDLKRVDPAIVEAEDRVNAGVGSEEDIALISGDNPGLPPKDVLDLPPTTLEATGNPGQAYKSEPKPDSTAAKVDPASVAGTSKPDPLAKFKNV